MQRIVIFLSVLFALQLPAKADEGMWLPFMISEELYEEMARMGLNLTPEEVFSFTEPGIKDAVVSFGGFCTAEIISDRGLLLTNHHCGYGRIQNHSSVDNDLLTNGFWAMSTEEELPNEGLFVRFLVSVEEVTLKILEAVTPEMTEQERILAIRERSRELSDAATEGTHYTATVSSMFAGNFFYLFTYETFNDVRLAGAPPSSIGAFGGDTDNWEWPRHTGDFALFRVYTAPDGSPAAYDPENIPLRPRYHLPISLRGVGENDFAMILGYAGRTERYLTSFGIDYRLEYMYPVRIDIRRRKLDILERAMAESDTLRIQYASKHAGIANYWKNFIGMSESLRRLEVARTKRELEDRFGSWVAADPVRQERFGEVLEDFRGVYEGLHDFRSHPYVFAETMLTGPDAISLARFYNTIYTMLEEDEDEEAIAREARRLREIAERSFRGFDREVDRELWAAMFATYHEYVPEEDLPDVFARIQAEFDGDFERYAEAVYETSIFANPDAMMEFLESPTSAVLSEDLAMSAVQSVFEASARLNERIAEHNRKLQRAERLFLKGLLEMDPFVPYYPDANRTMRFTYGSVNGYQPRDAVTYHYHTTLSGVMEKEDPNHHEFVVPEKLRQLYEEGDFGEYAHNERMVVNFITSNDITGGNSGSPVINDDGHLIGVAFDANWEGMSGDILFEHELQRAINVDIRYVLFIIDRFAGASHLIDEMTIVR